jgi:hypothetical protein
MSLEHGRTRYTRGCRCDVCTAAERDYQRDRYRRQRGLPVDPSGPTKLNESDPQPASSPGGSVVAAVRAELATAGAAVERPGLTAVALALAEILDDPRHIVTQPAAARQLVAILGMLSKRTQPRGKLALVKSMTTSSPSA